MVVDSRRLLGVVTMSKSAVLSPRQSGELISKLAKHVTIADEGIDNLSKEIATRILSKTISVDLFSQHELHPSFSDPSAIDWIFLVDTLNFAFWSPDLAHWSVSHRGKVYTGYFALCAAINRAKDEGQDITDPAFYSSLKTSDLTKLLRGDAGSAELALLNERAACLREVGQVLIEKYQGTFENCVKACNNSAQRLLQLVVTDFPCFRDEAQYEGHAVSFYKRAQILVGDIWACFRGENLGYFRDIHTITMFADYRVPQVLVHFGVLKYSKELLEKLNSGELLPKGSPEESEIRGCSIQAVELLCARAKDMIANVSGDKLVINPILIDHFLWDFRRQHAAELATIPFHKVLTVFY